MKYFAVCLAILPLVFCQYLRYPDVTVYFYKSGGLKACVKSWDIPNMKQFEFNANINDHIYLKQAGKINGTVVGNIDNKWCFVTKKPLFVPNSNQYIKYWTRITTSTKVMSSNVNILYVTGNNSKLLNTNYVNTPL